MEPKRVYLDSRRLAWFGGVSMVLIMAASLYVMGKDAGAVLAAGLPSLGVLATGLAAADRWFRPPTKEVL